MLFDRESIALEGLSNHFFQPFLVAFRWLFSDAFLDVSDVFVHLHMRPGLTPILGLTNTPGLIPTAGADPHFGDHKQAGAHPRPPPGHGSLKAGTPPKAGAPIQSWDSPSARATPKLGLPQRPWLPPVTSQVTSQVTFEDDWG